MVIAPAPKKKEIKRVRNLSDRSILVIVFSVVPTVFVIILWILMQTHGWSAYYSLDIITSNDSNYTLILPVIMKNENEVSNIMNEIKLTKGQAIFNIIDTPYGKGIKIEGQNNIKIYFEKRVSQLFSMPEGNENYRTTNLSMWKNFDNRTRGEYVYGQVWIYAYSKSWKQNISYFLSSSWTLRDSLYYHISSSKIISSNNWQEANSSVTLWAPV